MIHSRKHTRPPAPLCRWLGSLQHLPPPGLRLPSTLSPHRSRMSPRLPHPGCICDGDCTLTPAASSSPGCKQGDPDPRYGETRTSSSRPFHHQVHGLSCLPTPAHSTRNGGASSLQSSSRPSAGVSAGNAHCRQRSGGGPPTGVATHDLQREESDAQRTQTLTVGLGDLNLLFPSPP